MRDYGTAKWIGGNINCDHVSSKSRTDIDRMYVSNNIMFEYYKDICGKCGAKRIDHQLGAEFTLDEYIINLVNVFVEVKRVLRDDGTLWLNLGDSYFNKSKKNYYSKLKSKDMCGIPWRVAFALQADGWYLRQDIIWNKPNVMPESVMDRCTKSHEYIFLLAKSAKYYYDNEAVKENSVDKESFEGRRPRNPDSSVKTGDSKLYNGFHKLEGRVYKKKNLRSVWPINTYSYKGAHFATFPPKLPKLCIKAGTSNKGQCIECGKVMGRVIGATGWVPNCNCNSYTLPQIVLDPFMGSGTTLMVANFLKRRSIGIELNEQYVKMAVDRLNKTDSIKYNPVKIVKR